MGLLPILAYQMQKGFLYDADRDVYVCPRGEELTYATTDRDGYRHYTPNPVDVRNASLPVECTQNQKHQKNITRHVWEDNKRQLGEGESFSITGG
ncbi:hypothetical protein MUO14_18790 [Halobacillus shinanisalinarum]|uniref:Uncharacterized protein n=1 Tax=Halobacillus shinanisalinarum TaxID=2932258 RepID=A0ABY4GXP2_9BACI|nr:hypothetical protein [Halobacillus shinanisalinarum]UOQ92480.1 hypothetical protein MUO14_18790 [Halobacillus shinanisalinarum]